MYGPGLSRDDNVTDLLFKILKHSNKPIVIDADGLYALSKNINILNEITVPTIITSHIGEFERLTGYSKEHIFW